MYLFGTSDDDSAFEQAADFFFDFGFNQKLSDSQRQAAARAEQVAAATPTNTPVARLPFKTEQQMASSFEESSDALSDSSESFFCSAAARQRSVPWLAEEDEFLLSLVKQYNFKCWAEIAAEMSERFASRPRRSCNQCNQRWTRVLDPQIVKGKWTEAEDARLLAAVQQCAPRRWKDVAARMPGRTDIQVRYRVRKLAHWLQQQGVSKQLLE